MLGYFKVVSIVSGTSSSGKNYVRGQFYDVDTKCTADFFLPEFPGIDYGSFSFGEDVALQVSIVGTNARVIGIQKVPLKGGDK